MPILNLKLLMLHKDYYDKHLSILTCSVRFSNWCIEGNFWWRHLAGIILKTYLSLLDDKKLPGCSDGALLGVTRDLEHSKCMSHSMGNVLKSYLKNYLSTQFKLHWQNLQTFWGNANHAPNDKIKSFNRWLKSNPRPSSDDLQTISEYMNETVNMKGEFEPKKYYFWMRHILWVIPIWNQHFGYG